MKKNKIFNKINKTKYINKKIIMNSNNKNKFNNNNMNKSKKNKFNLMNLLKF